MNTEATTAHRIEIRIRELSQLFNSMDPTPFHHQDLDPNAEEFILSWAHEHPREGELEILIHLTGKLDRLAADLAVLDVLERPRGQVHCRLEGLPAVGALHGDELAEPGRLAHTRLEHRLEAVQLVDRLRVQWVTRCHVARMVSRPPNRSESMRKTLPRRTRSRSSP